MRHPELGRLITRMVKSLNAQDDLKMAGTMERLGHQLSVMPDTIYKWRRGRHKPEPSVLAELVKIGVAEAGMDQKWAERVLYRGEHPDRATLLSHLFPQDAVRVRHNLPRRPYIRLVGREKELAEIRGRLVPESRHWLAPIEGVGGVGKSALALEVGWHFVENYERLPPGRRFVAIIWVSAKRELLTTHGIESRRAAFTNLDDIYRAIADVLDWPAIRRVEREEQHREVVKALRQAGQVLLITDNLETVDDPEVLAFLRDLPPPAKAVTTMRFHEDMPYPIRLRELDNNAAKELVAQECAMRDLTLTEEQITDLLACTRGLPLAIWWAVGLMAMQGYGIEATLQRLSNPSGDLQRFIFSEALTRLHEHNPLAQEVLQALTFFDLDSGATKEALAATVGAPVEQALKQLLNLNLVNRHQSGKRFTMLPLTRDFAQQEITPEWERQARERWSEYFRQYVEQYGNDDFGEGLSRESREKLEDEINNIQLAIEWGFEHKPTTAVRLVERITTFLLDEGYSCERRKLSRCAATVANTPESQAGLLTRFAWSCLTQGSYEEAKKAHDAGLSIARKHGLQDRLVQLLRDSAHWYSLHAQYDEAYQRYEESLGLAEQIGSEIGLLEAKSFRARTRYISGDQEQAKQDLLELLPDYERSHPRQLLFTLRFLGQIAISMGQFSEARRRLLLASEHAKTYYEAEEVARLNRNWGDLERATGNPTTALEFYQKGLHLATRLGMQPEVEVLEERIREVEGLAASRDGL